jgi:hypothetical protein
MGFAAYWRWKSRSPGGRPRIGKEVRDLIQRMSFENPLWAAPRVHGELLKLGIEVAQSTVSIYMMPRRGRPLQTWETFLHAEGIASIDLFVVPTIAFEQLFAFLALGHRRRRGAPKSDGGMVGAANHRGVSLTLQQFEADESGQFASKCRD